MSRVTFRPPLRLVHGSAIGGIDWTLFIGRDLEIETDGEVVVIKGIY